MATREENIAKINSELEKLTDEELDAVAGGTYFQSSDDAMKFKELGVDLGIPFIGETPGRQIAVMGHEEFVKLRGAFEKYGVSIKDHGGLINDNEYFIDGNQVGHEAAWKHIEKQLGK